MQLLKQLLDTAEVLREIGRLGPRPPGVSIDRWARMSMNDRKALIGQTVEFYEIHKDRVQRVCRLCGAGVERVVDVELGGDAA